jgi:hypothetical protein
MMVFRHLNLADNLYLNILVYVYKINFRLLLFSYLLKKKFPKSFCIKILYELIAFSTYSDYYPDKTEGPRSSPSCNVICPRTLFCIGTDIFLNICTKVLCFHPFQICTYQCQYSFTHKLQLTIGRPAAPLLLPSWLSLTI